MRQRAAVAEQGFFLSAQNPDGSPGELMIRQPAITKGYWRQEDTTASVLENGWYRSGDIARCDEEGLYYIVDRAKDMIISGGFNIYPVDLEAVLLQHPDVEEAAVIGMPSEQWGETPVGFVTPAKGATLDTAAVLAATNALLGKTQRLSALYDIAEMPRSHIGKLLKTDLRDLAAEKQHAS